MAPRVSILVPSFDSGRFLPASLRSALAQDGVELELIVQDGGSTDGSIAAASAELDDPRVRLAVEPDAGQADALNRALARARGEWVVWLNADDLLEPHALRRLLSAARPETELVFGEFRTIDADGRPLKRYEAAPLELERLLRHGHYVFSGALLVRRELLLRLGGFRTDLAYCMDYDLLLRLARATAGVHVPDVVASYRVQPASKTSTAAWRFVREHARVAREHGGFRPRHAPGTAWAILLHAAYVATRPLWQTRLWRRARPVVRRGGAA